MSKRILIRGGGDLASGVAARLHRAGFEVLITELPQPLVVRRLVSFAEAVYAGVVMVEEITARLVDEENSYLQIWEQGEIAVMVDSDLKVLGELKPDAMVDARMMKQSPEVGIEAAPFIVGLGPGFTVGEHCHAVVETLRGHDMGRVIWQGSALPNTGVPEAVMRKQGERVLRAPVDGVIKTFAEIGEIVEDGALVAEVEGEKITAPFKGVIRGLLKAGLNVKQGMKVGDLDPRGDVRFCTKISDKSMAVGGGVLEAVMMHFSNMR